MHEGDCTWLHLAAFIRNSGTQLRWVSLSCARAMKDRNVDIVIGRTTKDNLETLTQNAGSLCVNRYVRRILITERRNNRNLVRRAIEQSLEKVLNNGGDQHG